MPFCYIIFTNSHTNGIIRIGYWELKGIFMLKIKNKAFTMAEIMIALSIIGIVAAMTLPALLGNTTGRANKLMIQKSYATLAQGLRIAQGKLEYNTSEVDRIINLTSSTDMEISIENLLTKAMDVTRSDKTSHAFSGKLVSLKSDGTALERASSASSSGISVSTSGDTRGAIFEGRDGVLYIFPDKSKIADDACTKDSPCIAYIDVNGTQPPNMLVSCITDSATKLWVKDTSTASCSVDTSKVSDVYPIVIYGGTIAPAINAVDEILTSNQ